MIKFKLKGGKELEDALWSLAHSVRKPVVRRALLEAGQPVATAMGYRAPHLTGQLGGDIVVVPMKAHPRHGETVGIGPIADHFYGRFSEFGTAHEPARPWARPAWDATKDEALKRFGAALWDEIRKAARRAARKAPK